MKILFHAIMFDLLSSTESIYYSVSFFSVLYRNTTFSLFICLIYFVFDFFVCFFFCFAFPEFSIKSFTISICRCVKRLFVSLKVAARQYTKLEYIHLSVRSVIFIVIITQCWIEWRRKISNKLFFWFKSFHQVVCHIRIFSQTPIKYLDSIFSVLVHFTRTNPDLTLFFCVNVKNQNENVNRTAKFDYYFRLNTKNIVFHTMDAVITIWFIFSHVFNLFLKFRISEYISVFFSSRFLVYLCESALLSKLFSLFNNFLDYF